MSRAFFAGLASLLCLVFAPAVLAQDAPPVDNPLVEEEGIVEIEPEPVTAPDPTSSNTTEALLCPPIDAKVGDAPDDEGDAVRVTWLPCGKSGVPAAANYFVYRAEKKAGSVGKFFPVADIPAGQGPNFVEKKGKKTYVFRDSGLSQDISYLYRVAAVDGDRLAYAFTMAEKTPLVNMGPVSPERQVIPFADRGELAAGFGIPAPTEVEAHDKPNDAGGAVIVSWTPSPGGVGLAGFNYRIYRSTNEPTGGYSFVGSVDGDKDRFEDASLKGKPRGQTYYYLVAAANAPATMLAVSARSPGVKATVQVINWDTWNFFLFALVLAAFIIYFIQHIKSGKKLFIRKIAGLEAVEESIGRATEMGKPVLFIPGILDMNDVQTVAAMVILGRIARQVAEYDTRLMCPTSKSLVMTTGREMVKEAFISVGRPDAYNDDIVTYLTDEQFGYVAGVNGMMVRDKPATCLYFGAFFAESLILAETGNSIGAIQIAGTAMPSQLPFFIAACDYTLIGEELFAASAYLSNDPKQLGSLKGQDIGKILGMGGMIFGSIFATIVEITGAGWAQSAMEFTVRLFTPAAG